MTSSLRKSLLIPYYWERSNGESEQALAMFEKFVSKGFSYKEISNHPDFTVYASADLLLKMIPWIIDGMKSNDDKHNYLVYPILSTIDPDGSSIDSYKERTAKLIEIADKNFTEKVMEFLFAQLSEPPIPHDKFDKIFLFWKNFQLHK
jgi:hypothetical protein